MTALLNRSGIVRSIFSTSRFLQFDGQASFRPAAMNVMVLLSFQAASVADDDKLGEVRTNILRVKLARTPLA